MSVEERYFERHFRVLRVVSGSRVLYSIDYYKLLKTPVDCNDYISVGEYKICYHKLGKCTAVILETPGRVELVNLRLETSIDMDPGFAGARRICISEADGI